MTNKDITMLAGAVYAYRNKFTKKELDKVITLLLCFLDKSVKGFNKRSAMLFLEVAIGGKGVFKWHRS